jgi:hypothetical protein
VDLVCLARLPWLILQPSVASTVIFYKFPHEPLALLSQGFYHEKLSAICVKENFLNNASQIHLIAIVMKTQATTHCCLKLFSVEIPSWMGFWVKTFCCLRPFRWESLRGWDFRTQLVVISGLFGGNPFVDGILQSLFIKKPFSRTFFFFHDGILAITKPFSRTFFFCHDGILAITKPFSRTFFFFHDGILPITKPFSRTFFFFHDGILAITKPFS